MSKVGEFRRQLGKELERRHAGEYRFLVSRETLVRKQPDGDDAVYLDVTSTCSPFVSLYLLFGRRFDAATKAERWAGKSASYYQVIHYSVNEQMFRRIGWDAPRKWRLDLREVPNGLVDEVETLIRNFGDPWFDRFRDLRVARDAIIDSGTDWCLSGDPHAVLALDAALGDVDDMRRCVESQKMYRHEQMADLARRYAEYVKFVESS